MESDDILFIYDDKPGSRKQARKHVSKVVRRREQRQRASDPFVPEKFTNRISSYSQGKETQARISAESRKAAAAKLISKDSEGAKGDQPGDVAFNKSDKADDGDAHTKSNGGYMLYVPTRPQYHYSTVDSHFSAARSDPFCTLPITLDAESAKCLDHFNTSMPFLEFCVYEGAPLIPSRHVAFRSALETPAALHAIIATGATHLASLYGVETVLVIQHHIGQALEILRRELLTVSKYNWSRVAHTMTEIAAGDDFRGQIQNSRVHLNGLRELMGHFGGISKLGATPKVQLLVCYVLNGCTAPYFPIIRCTRGIFDKLQSLLCSPNTQFGRPLKVADLFPFGLSKAQHRVLFDVSAHVQEFCRFIDKLRPSTTTKIPTTKSATNKTTQNPNPTITRIQRLPPSVSPCRQQTSAPPLHLRT